jgi:hypothetical protein
VLENSYVGRRGDHAPIRNASRYAALTAAIQRPAAAQVPSSTVGTLRNPVSGTPPTELNHRLLGLHGAGASQSPAHSWQATACASSSIGRKGMLVAARTLALSAMDLLDSPNEVDAAKTSFEKRRAGRAWSTLIAPGTKPPLDYAGK